MSDKNIRQCAKKADKFTSHTNDSVWKTLAQPRKIAGIFVPLKSYTGERPWKVTGDRLQEPCYLNSDDHDRKIMVRKQRTVR
jgi:hypothetical protein